MGTAPRSLEQWLCLGGDERSVLGADGLNRYGGAVRPRPGVGFGSCTSSAISPRGWAAARSALEAFQWRAAADGEPAAADALGRWIRDGLLDLMELRNIQGLRVVLTPSGTDAESVALGIAGWGHRRPLVNIVVGAREVGSGSVLAAGARYFSRRLPSGRSAEPGVALDADLAGRTLVHEIKIRGDSAAERAPGELDAEILGRVRAGLARGAKVVVHVVAHSKTGVHAPRLETLNALIDRHGDDLIPIIDAAQGRFSRRGLRDYLARGCMVILTGSKFYGGPPFSGCLLIPARRLPEDQTRIRFPSGFSAYLTPAQLPEDWTQAREALAPAVNLGLLLRWEAALAEMRAYYATPPLARYRVLRFFESQAPAILGRSPLLEPINVPTPLYDDASERLLESKTTVFSFRVKACGVHAHQLEKPDLERWLRWMNRDISGLAAEKEERVVVDAARVCFQLGQSVHVGRHDHVIRVAIGGVLIADIAADTALGVDLEARLAWLASKLEQTRLKLEFIAAHEAALLAREV